MPPKSIRDFRMVYAGAILLGIVGSALSWDEMTSTVQVQRAIATIGAWYPVAIAGVGTAISLLLLYFIAWRGSAVAKWIFVVLVGFGIFAQMLALATGPAGGSVSAIIGIAIVVLDVIGAWLLFRPDTRSWFGEETTPVDGPAA